MDGVRRPKDDIAFEALGAVDEAQVTLGVCRALVAEYLYALRDGAYTENVDGQTSTTPIRQPVRRRGFFGNLFHAGRRTIAFRGSVLGGSIAGAKASKQLKRLQEDIEQIQYDLLNAGGVLSSTRVDVLPETMPRINQPGIDRLAQMFQRWRGLVQIQPRFFIAGESILGAEFDRARTVVRRAERRVVTVIRERGNQEQIPVSQYLNQLSDLCFVLARWADATFPVI